MPTIKVKTEYINKLKQLGIYDAWLSNVKNQWDGKYLLQNIDKINSFANLIYYSFDWSHTIDDINVNWHDIYKNNL